MARSRLESSCCGGRASRLSLQLSKCFNCQPAVSALQQWRNSALDHNYIRFAAVLIYTVSAAGYQEF